MSETSENNQAPRKETPKEEEANSSHESMDYKVPDSIAKDALGISTTVGTEISEARQLLLLLATDETADDQRKETLVSALRALDSALKALPLAVTAQSESPTSASSNDAVDTETTGSLTADLTASSQTPILAGNAVDVDFVSALPAPALDEGTPATASSQTSATTPSFCTIEVGSVVMEVPVTALSQAPVTTTEIVSHETLHEAETVLSETTSPLPSHDEIVVGSVLMKVGSVSDVPSTMAVSSQQSLLLEADPPVRFVDYCGSPQLDTEMVDVESKPPTLESHASLGKPRPRRSGRRSSCKRRSRKTSNETSLESVVPSSAAITGSDAGFRVAVNAASRVSLSTGSNNGIKINSMGDVLMAPTVPSFESAIATCSGSETERETVIILPTNSPSEGVTSVCSNSATRIDLHEPAPKATTVPSQTPLSTCFENGVGTVSGGAVSMTLRVPSQTLIFPCLSSGVRNESGIGLPVPTCAPSESLTCGTSDDEVQVKSVGSEPVAETVSSMSPISTCFTSGSTDSSATLQEAFTASSERPVDVGTAVGSALIDLCALPAPPSNTEAHSPQALPLQREDSVTSVHCHSSEVDFEMVDQVAKVSPSSNVAKMKRTRKSKRSSRKSGSRKNSNKASLESVAPSSVLSTGSDVGLEAVSAASEASLSACPNSGIKIDSEGAEQVSLTLPSFDSPIPTCSKSELETEREAAIPLAINEKSESLIFSSSNNGIGINLDEAVPMTTTVPSVSASSKSGIKIDSEGDEQVTLTLPSFESPIATCSGNEFETEREAAVPLPTNAAPESLTSESSNNGIRIDLDDAVPMATTVQSQTSVSTCSEKGVETVSVGVVPMAVRLPSQTLASPCLSSGVRNESGNGLPVGTCAPSESLPCGTLDNEVKVESTVSLPVDETLSSMTPISTCLTSGSTDTSGTLHEAVTVSSEIPVDIGTAVGSALIVLGGLPAPPSNTEVQSLQALPLQSQASVTSVHCHSSEVDVEMVDEEANVSPASKVATRKRRRKSRRSSRNSGSRKNSKKASLELVGPLPVIIVTAPSDTSISACSNNEIKINSEGAEEERLTQPSLKSLIATCSKSQFEAERKASQTLVSPCLSTRVKNESGIGLPVGTCAPSESLTCGTIDNEGKVESMVSLPVDETLSSMTPISTSSTSGSTDTSGTLHEAVTVSSEIPVGVGTAVGSAMIDLGGLPVPPSNTEVQSLPLQSEASVTSMHCHSSEVEIEMVDEEANVTPASKVPKIKRRGKSRRSSRNSGSRKNSKKASLELVGPLPVIMSDPHLGVGVTVTAASEASIYACSNNGIKIDSEGAQEVTLTQPSLKSLIATCSKSEFEAERKASQTLASPCLSSGVRNESGIGLPVGTCAPSESLTCGTLDNEVQVESMVSLPVDETLSSMTPISTCLTSGSTDTSGTLHEAVTVSSEIPVDVGTAVGSALIVLGGLPAPPSNTEVQSLQALPLQSQASVTSVHCHSSEVDVEMVDEEANVSPASKVATIKRRRKSRRSSRNSGSRKNSKKASLELVGPLPVIMSDPHLGVGVTVTAASEASIYACSNNGIKIDSEGAQEVTLTQPSLKSLIATCSESEFEAERKASQTLASPCLSSGVRNESGIGLPVGTCAPSESLTCGTLDNEVQVESMVSLPVDETLSSMTPISTCLTSGSTDTSGTLHEAVTVSSETPVDVGTAVGSAMIDLGGLPAPPSNTVVQSLQALPLQSEASLTSVHCHSSEVEIEMVDEEANVTPASKVPKIKRRGKSRRSSRNSGSRKNSKKASLELVGPLPVIMSDPHLGVGVTVTAASEASIYACSNNGIKIDSEGAQEVTLTQPSLKSLIATCSKSEFEAERKASQTLASPCLSSGVRNESGIGLPVGTCAPSESLTCGTLDNEVQVESMVSLPVDETLSSMTPISTCLTSGSTDTSGTLHEAVTVSSEIPVDVGTAVGSALIVLGGLPAPPSNTEVQSLQALPLQSQASVTSVHCHSSEVDVEMVDQNAKVSPASKVAKMKRRGKSRRSSRNSGSRKNSKKVSLESVAPSSVLSTGADVGLEAVSAASEASLSACPSSGIKIDSEGAEQVTLILPLLESPISTCSKSEFESEREAAAPLATKVQSECVIPSSSNNGIGPDLDEAVPMATTLPLTQPSLKSLIATRSKSEFEAEREAAVPPVTNIEPESLIGSSSNNGKKSALDEAVPMATTVPSVFACSNGGIKINSVGAEQVAPSLPSLHSPTATCGENEFETEREAAVPLARNVQSDNGIGTDLEEAVPMATTMPSQTPVSTCFENEVETVSVDAVAVVVSVPSQTSVFPCFSNGESGIGLPVPTCAPSESLIRGSSDNQVQVESVVSVPVAETVSSMTPISTCSTSGCTGSGGTLQQAFTVSSETPVDVETKVGSALIQHGALPAPPSSTEVHSLQAPPLRSEASVRSVHYHGSEVDVETASKVETLQRRGKRKRSSRNSGPRNKSMRSSLESVASPSVLSTGSDVGLEVAISAASEASLSVCSNSGIQIVSEGAEQVAPTLSSLKSPKATCSESEFETERDAAVPLPTNAAPESLTSECSNSGIRIDLDEAVPMPTAVQSQTPVSKCFEKGVENVSVGVVPMAVRLPSQTLVSPCAPSESLTCGIFDNEVKVESMVSLPVAETVSSTTPISTCSTSRSTDTSGTLHEAVTVSSETPVDVGTAVGSALIVLGGLPVPPSNTEVQSLQALPLQSEASVTSVHCHSSEVEIEMVDEEANVTPASKVPKIKRRGKSRRSSRNSGSRKNSKKASLELVGPLPVIMSDPHLGVGVTVTAASEASIYACSNNGIKIDSEGAQEVTLTQPSLKSLIATCSKSEFEAERKDAVPLAAKVRPESLIASSSYNGNGIDRDEAVLMARTVPSVFACSNSGIKVDSVGAEQVALTLPSLHSENAKRNENDFETEREAAVPLARNVQSDNGIGIDLDEAVPKATNVPSQTPVSTWFEKGVGTVSVDAVPMVVSVPSPTRVFQCLRSGVRNESGIGLPVGTCAPSESLICGSSDNQVQVESVVSAPVAETVSSMSPISTCLTSGSTYSSGTLQEAFTVSSETPVDVGSGVGSVIELGALPASPSNTEVHSLQALPLRSEALVRSMRFHSSEVDVEMVDQEAKVSPASKVETLKRRRKRQRSSHNSGPRNKSMKSSLESVAPSSVFITGSDVGLEVAISAASEASLSVCSNSGIKIDSEGTEEVAPTLSSLKSPNATCSESEFETERDAAVPLPTNAALENVTSECSNSGIRIDLDEAVPMPTAVQSQTPVSKCFEKGVQTVSVGVVPMAVRLPSQTLVSPCLSGGVRNESGIGLPVGTCAPSESLTCRTFDNEVKVEPVVSVPVAETASSMAPISMCSNGGSTDSSATLQEAFTVSSETPVDLGTAVGSILMGISTLPTPPSNTEEDSPQGLPLQSGEHTRQEAIVEAPPMTATVKTEQVLPEVPGVAESDEPQDVPDTMGFVRYYVRAAFEALFGANFQAQVAAVSALPPNWGQPTDERLAQIESNRPRRRRVRRVWNGEAFVAEEARQEENGPYTRRRRRRH